MVLQVGMPDRAEVYLVVLHKRVERVVRHHLPVLEIVVRPPRKLRELQGNLVVPCDPIQDLQSLLDHVDANAVSSNDGDFVLGHGKPLDAGQRCRTRGERISLHNIHGNQTREAIAKWVDGGFTAAMQSLQKSFMGHVEP